MTYTHTFGIIQMQSDKILKSDLTVQIIHHLVKAILG